WRKPTAAKLALLEMTDAADTQWEAKLAAGFALLRDGAPAQEFAAVPALFHLVPPDAQEAVRTAAIAEQTKASRPTLLLDALPKLGDEPIEPYGKPSEFLGKSTGHQTLRDKNQNEIAIRFDVSIDSPNIAAEEMALLRAAEVTQRLNLNAFTIIANDNYTRTAIVPGSLFSFSHEDPAGFSTQLKILPLDAAAPPAPWPDRVDRIWKVQDVERELRRRYDGPPTTR
ncbi:MAG: hypothetical protein K2P95_06670, partial [Hyphomonadaceae bacterium]|nr:hypothetical protein [Hyphomonadaceae bacterium]